MIIVATGAALADRRGGVGIGPARPCGPRGLFFGPQGSTINPSRTNISHIIQFVV